MRARTNAPVIDGSARQLLSRVPALVVLLVLAPTPVLAQSDPSSGEDAALGGLVEIIIDAATELLRVLFSPIATIIEDHGDDLLGLVVGTPAPNSVFGTPTNGPWPGIYGYYWETIVPLSVSLFGLSVGLIILFESTSHLFGSYHRTKLKKRAFSGLLGILSWWWIAALSLQFVDSLARFLVPSLSDISLFQTLSFSGMGVLGLVIALSTDLVLFVLIGVLYLARRLVLYLFVLLMPLLIVFWIPGVGPFSLVSKFMRKLAGFYVPFLFMTVPVALLFRLGELLGQSAGFSAGGIGAWLTALVVPFVAVASPFVLFWQAGLVLLVADKAARHMSAQRARSRVSQGRERIRQASRGGRNFIRGVRDQPAVLGTGQTMLESGNSQAHAAGKRVNRGRNRLRGTIAGRGSGGSSDSDGDGDPGSERFDSDSTGGGGGRSGGSDTGDEGSRPNGGPGSSDDDGSVGSASRDSAINDDGPGSDASGRRTIGRDELRDPPRSSRDRDSDYIDDEPRYLQ